MVYGFGDHCLILCLCSHVYLLRSLSLSLSFNKIWSNLCFWPFKPWHDLPFVVVCDKILRKTHKSIQPAKQTKCAPLRLRLFSLGLCRFKYVFVVVVAAYCLVSALLILSHHFHLSKLIWNALLFWFVCVCFSLSSLHFFLVYFSAVYILLCIWYMLCMWNIYDFSALYVNQSVKFYSYV